MNPCLRFQNFKEDWENDLFSELVTNKSKKFNPKKNESTQDIELDSIEQNTGRLLNTYMSNQFTSQKNIFNKNSVLYSKLRPYLNKYYYSQIEGVCSSEIWVLNTLNKDVLSNKFLYYFIQTNRFSSVANKSAGSKMPRADWGLVENIRLYRGAIEEQEKIGDFFSKLDHQIELEEKKLELLEQQKRGYMQKIFSQELRFKDNNGNSYLQWKEFNFFEVLDKIIDFRGRTPKKLDMEWSTEGYLALSAINVKKGYIDFNVEAKYGDEKLYKKWMNKNELQKGQVLFTTEAPMGNVAQVPDNRGYILSQRTIAFNTNKKITNDFLASLLSTKKVYNELLRLSSGATAKGVSQKTLKSLYITIPLSIEEQQKIGNFFNKIDNLIKRQSDKIESLKERKKSLLQKMFV